jgi:hypothetical protein
MLLQFSCSAFFLLPHMPLTKDFDNPTVWLGECLAKMLLFHLIRIIMITDNICVSNLFDNEKSLIMLAIK